MKRSKEKFGYCKSTGIVMTCLGSSKKDGKSLTYFMEDMLNLVEQNVILVGQSNTILMSQKIKCSAWYIE